MTPEEEDPILLQQVNQALREKAGLQEEKISLQEEQISLQGQIIDALQQQITLLTQQVKALENILQLTSNDSQRPPSVTRFTHPAKSVRKKRNKKRS